MNYKEELKFATYCAFTIGLAIATGILIVAWFDGHAKTAYLKQTQNIEIPWYQATFLTVIVEEGGRGPAHTR